MHLLFPVFLLLFTVSPAAASPARVTYFLDAARVELEAEAVQGRIGIPLPRGVDVDSLRVRPLQGASINRVEFMAARPDRNGEREVARLAERRDMLSDRLRALEVKEEILRAAAKSQSAKSPRSTKNNSNPLETIRKGTEFAITRLEEVYRARRRAENEIKSLEARIAEHKGAGEHDKRFVQVVLAEKRGRVQVSYRDPGLKWAPVYDFRLHDRGEVEVIVSARLPSVKKGELVSVAPGLFSENPVAVPVAIAPDGAARVAAFRFPLEKEEFSPGPVSSVAFSFTNRSAGKLPPGDSTCYRWGEYIGKARFEGALPGDSKRLVFGSAPAASR